MSAAKINLVFGWDLSQIDLDLESFSTEPFCVDGRSKVAELRLGYAARGGAPLVFGAVLETWREESRLPFAKKDWMADFEPTSEEVEAAKVARDAFLTDVERTLESEREYLTERQQEVQVEEVGEFKVTLSGEPTLFFMWSSE